MSIAGFTVEQLLVLPVAILAFIVLLTIIVFVHEYGHFSVARALGVRVDVFSIGFGKPLARWIDKKGTEWRIARWPLGGYVKFFGDAGPASDASEAVTRDQDDQGSIGTTQFPKPGEEAQLAQQLTPEERAVCFHFKPLWRRAAIVAAGPFANFILAAVIFWGILVMLGASDYEMRIGAVTENSAAADAGLLKGDLLLSVNGRKLRGFNDLSMEAKLGAGEILRFEVDRNGEPLTIEATPRRTEQKDAFGNTITMGLLGVAPDPAGFKRTQYGPLEAIAPATAQVWDILATTVKFIGRLIRGKEDASALGGPIKMAQYAGQSALSGFDESSYAEKPSLWVMFANSLAMFVNLAAVVSVSIGFLNLLPVPVLDGGHLMYYGYEAVAGKPLGAQAQSIGFKLGLVMLASLMIFVTLNDITSLLLTNR